ncbi:MAG: diguanylate cyclase [Spirulina sp. SIO3F2]|nr:diguanylate cyclase [Spirulina sp. SIO3F2]
MFAHTPALVSVDLNSAIVRTPLTIAPETALAEALTLMSQSYACCPTSDQFSSTNLAYTVQAQASCVVVVEAEQVIGILTERDMLRLSLQQQSLAELTVRQAMTCPVITLKESALRDIFSVILMIHQYHIRHLPILDEHERLSGLITHQTLQQLTHPIDLLRLRPVKEVMVEQVVCAHSDVSLQDIAQQMVTHRISSIVITTTNRTASPQAIIPRSELGDLANVDGGGTSHNATPATEPLQFPVGILTERDLVQFQALGLHLQDYRSGELMSTPVFAVQPQQSLWTVQQMMQRHLISRVLVTGERGELLGIITQSSILQGLNPMELYKLAEGLEHKVERLEAEKLTLLKNRTVELEQQVKTRTLDLHMKVKREQLLNTLALKMHSSLDLQEILATTVDQVRQLLGCDRVSIWQLQDDGQSCVVAESTDSPISLLGEQINDTCFKQEMAEIYRQGHVRVVQDIYTTEMSDCHRELLIHLQIRAKVLLPLCCEEQLWGLLNATESETARAWQTEEIELLKALSVQLGIALQQATTHQQLQASNQRYASLATAAPVGIFRTDTMGNCLYVNERWCTIAGLSVDAAIGSGWSATLHPADRASISQAWCQAAQEHRPFQSEYRFQRPDGVVTWVYGQGIVEQDAHGQTIGFLGTITDITQRKAAEEELSQMSQQLEILNQQLERQVAERTQALSHAVDELQAEVKRREVLEAELREKNQTLAALSQTDGLTQIANRRRFDQELAQEWRLAQREQISLALILFDVDYFKQYNDYYGHQQGDDCLIQLAQASQRTVHRPTDLAARYGGEEFVILLPKTDRAGAISVATTLQANIAALAIPHARSSVSEWVTVSIGIAVFIPSFTSIPAETPKQRPETFLYQADQALYAAKQQGRNCYVVQDYEISIEGVIN